jgi:hypothetical protein
MAYFNNDDRNLSRQSLSKYTERVVQEMHAIDAVYSTLRYLGYSPKQDTWKNYCAAFSRKLADELRHIPSDNG